MIVTRGDVDLRPVLNSLIFDDVVVWNNSKTVYDIATAGRILACNEVKNSVVYSQDGDIIHTAENQQRIIDAYEPGVLAGCMWEEWSNGARLQGIENGYDDLVFPGSGSVFDRYLTNHASRRYLEHYPYDRFYQLFADTIVGVIAPTRQLDIRFQALPCAENENRMCNLPNAVALKSKAIRRARFVRGLAVAA